MFPVCVLFFELLSVKFSSLLLFLKLEGGFVLIKDEFSS